MAARVTLGAPVIEDEASITAHGGTIALTNLLPVAFGSAPAPIVQTPGSIVVAAGAVLDASGVWTNLARDPGPAGGQGFASGGTISVFGTGPVDLQAGTVLDVSSGGVLSAAGKLTAEAGGSITVSADIVPLQVATLDTTGAVTPGCHLARLRHRRGGHAFRAGARFPAGRGHADAPRHRVHR